MSCAGFCAGKSGLIIARDLKFTHSQTSSLTQALVGKHHLMIELHSVRTDLALKTLECEAAKASKTSANVEADKRESRL